MDVKFPISKSQFWSLLALVFMAHSCGLFLDVLEVDSAQLAEISRELLLAENKLHLTYLNEPYLDKPHLLFWLGALSMKIFGVSSFAYKLPTMLFAMLCVGSVYGFAKLFYNEAIAQVSAIVTASVQAMFVATNDVRTDAVLMGCVMFSIWQWAAYFKHMQLKNLLLGSIGIAFSVMAKGPIGMVCPALAFAPALLITGEWRKVFHFNSLIAVGVIAVFLFPISYAHFHQFGWEGLRFFYWTQSFGRITGESEWNNHPDTFFVLHTTVWAFLPFTLFLFAGWFSAVQKLLKRIPQPELYAFFGITLTLLALSRSNYQLPHYFYVAYPFGAVLAAQALVKNPSAQWQKALHALQHIVIALSIITPLVIVWWLFEQSGIVSILFTVAAVAVALYCIGSKNVFMKTVVAFVFLNVSLATVFYPELLKFQSNTIFGKHLKENGVNENELTVFDSYRTYALAFHAQLVPLSTNNYDEVSGRIENSKKHYIVCNEYSLIAMKETFNAEVVLETHDFPVSTLTIPFLNPKTRLNQTIKRYLLRVN